MTRRDIALTCHTPTLAFKTCRHLASAADWQHNRLCSNVANTTFAQLSEQCEANSPGETRTILKTTNDSGPADDIRWSHFTHFAHFNFSFSHEDTSVCHFDTRDSDLHRHMLPALAEFTPRPTAGHHCVQSFRNINVNDEVAVCNTDGSNLQRKHTIRY